MNLEQQRERLRSLGIDEARIEAIVATMDSAEDVGDDEVMTFRFEFDGQGAKPIE